MDLPKRKPDPKKVKQFARGRTTSSKHAEAYAQQARDAQATKEALAARRKAAPGKPATVKGVPRGAGAEQRAFASGQVVKGKHAEAYAQQAESPFKAARRQARKTGAKRRRAARSKPAQPAPGGYRTDDPARQARSPYFGYGADDGARDALLVSTCPPGAAIGPDESRRWSSMYRRGYELNYQPVPCPCDGSCRQGKQYGEAPDGAKTGG